MKKLMLLGDSIRLGYMDKVKEKLEGEYEVWGPEDNCRFAKYSLCCLAGWFETFPKPDVIHWNNGLWDACVRYAEDGCFSSVEEYTRDMLRILRELKKHCNRIIFATITPVNPNHANQNNDTIARYNAAIVPLLEAEGVEINDLNALVKPHIDEYICEDLIHLSEAGIEACAAQVVHAVKKTIS